MSNRFKRPRLSSGENKQIVKRDSKPQSKLFDELYEGTKEPERKKAYKIMGLVDATGSMYSTWNKVKSIIDELLRNIKQYGDISMNWVAYRDYCDGQRLIEQSGWTDKTSILSRFFNSIRCDGGDDYPEAVEHALGYADKDNPDFVFLIADAPPHEQKPYHYNLQTPFKDWQYQAKQLAQKNVKVYCFTLNMSQRDISKFKHISKVTGGATCPLNSVDDIYAVLSLIIGHEMGEESLEETIKTLMDKYGNALPPHVENFRKQLGSGK